MADENGEVDPSLFDRLILQVFEEQEERSGSLRYPLSSQRHALDFIKLINRKGFPYVLMCQAIEEKQEKFRSWRLGNGNAHIGLAMMKRINKTVQEAMLLPDADADIDIDDLIDDDDNSDDEDEADIDVDDLTTDEDDQHACTSSSSLPSPAAAAEITEGPDSSNSVPDDAVNDSKTTPVTEGDTTNNEANCESTDTQVSTAELQSSQQQQKEQEQQEVERTDQAEKTDGGDELRADVEDNDILEVSDKNECQSRNKDENSVKEDAVEEIVQRKDKPQQNNMEVTEKQDESTDNTDHDNILSLDQREMCDEAESDRAQASNSDVPESSQQTCQPEPAVTENNDIIPSTSMSVPTSSISISTEEPQRTDSEKTPKDEFIDADKREKDGVKEDVVKATEQGDTEHAEHVTADRHEQNYSAGTEQTTQEVHEPGSLTSQTDKGHRGSRDEEQQLKEQTDELNTVIEANEESCSSVKEDVKLEENVASAQDEVKVIEDSESKVAEETKVTYEASAKQLDLLSRLAMLREKAAQRKAQEPSDSASTQEPNEDVEASKHTNESADISQQCSTTQKRNDSAADGSMKADVTRKRSVQTDKDKTTSSQTDNETCKDVKDDQSRKVIGSEHSTLVTDGKSQPSQRDSNKGLCESSAIAQDSAVGTQSQAQAADKDVSSVGEHSSTSESSRHEDQGEQRCREDTSSTAMADDKSQLEQLNSTVQKGHREISEIAQNATDTCASPEAKTQSAGEHDGQHASKLTHDTTVSQTEADAEQQTTTSAGLTVKLTTSAAVNGSTNNSSSTADPKIVHTEPSCDVHDDTVTLESKLQPEPTQTDVHNGADDRHVQLEQLPSEAAESGTVAATQEADLAVKSETGQPVSDHISTSSAQLTTTGTLSDAVSSTTVSPEETSSSCTTESSDDISDAAAINYDSDLDSEFADTDTRRLVSDIQSMKSSRLDGTGYLYVFTDRPSEQRVKRFMAGTSRSPFKRLRQATVFNPDMTSVLCVPVKKRVAAFRELRRRLVERTGGTPGNSPRNVTACASSLYWFTCSDDVITELVTQVACDEGHMTPVT